ncbi:MAG: hypothetical protein KTV77_02430 [Wolbachia endosymbiont of Fragariocoptes setiger]|nr:hypothetical protein [Wolbachia endosymbiont of Fragariocoptes setiger]
MKIICITSIVIFFFSVIALFKVKLHSQELSRELMKIKNEISLAQSELKVLHAEWSYLNHPKRLECLVEKYLKNSSLISADQIKCIKRNINVLEK